LPRAVPGEETDDPRAPNSFLDFHLEASEILGDASGSAPLLKAELGVPVKVPANFF